MRPDSSTTAELARLTAAQGGVFTRAQAVEAGCREREIKTRSGPRGDWVRVHRGAYAPRTAWDEAEASGRYRLRVLGAMLCQTVPALPSHASAAVLLGLPLRPRWTELVHVTRPGVHGGRVEGGVNHHRARYDARDVVTIEGRDVLGPARTALDLALRFGFDEGVVAADAVLRAGTSRAELWRALETMRSWRHVTVARAAVDAADGGAENAGESLARLLVLEAGIGPVETQFALTDGRRTAYADMRVDSLLIEFDGKVKYLGRSDGGVADRPAHDVLWQEKTREDWMRRQGDGYAVSRLVWDDLWGARRREAVRRLRLEHARAVRLHGSGPPARRTA